MEHFLRLGTAVIFMQELQDSQSALEVDAILPHGAPNLAIR